MNRNRDMIQLQVGAFVTIGLVLVMMVLFLLGGEKQMFERHYILYSYFENISGLRVGAPVQLAGLHVGYVGQILFEENLDTKTVKVALHINDSYQDRIRSDSQASIMTQGLLGDKMIMVSVGTPTEKIMENGEELKTKPAYDLSQLLITGEEIISKVDNIAFQINDILSTVRDGEGLIHAMVYDPAGSEFFQNLRSTSQNLKTTSFYFQDILGKIDRGQGTVGALVNDATLYNDMKTLMGKANRNKLIRGVIRHTLKTKDEKLLQSE